MATTPEQWEIVRSLFHAYSEWVRIEHNIDLGFQSMESEINTLPGQYSEPGGCVLLASVDDKAAGCVGLSPLEPGICEMKRMFICQEFRGMGLGKALAEKFIQEACRKGYKLMRLDTADSMLAAQGLYLSLGFKQVAPYYDLPEDVKKRAVFMELNLQYRED